MKNLLGISLAAVLAVSPLMAKAADVDTTAATSAAGDDTTLTTVGYVKGAYSALATGVNSKQDKISDLETIRSGAAAGATALQNDDIATSLTAQSTDEKAAGAKATYDAIRGAITEATYDDTALAGRVTTAEGKITTLEGTVGNATSGLVKDVADNAAAIGVLNGTGAGSVTKTVGDAISALDLSNTYESKGAAAAAQTAAETTAKGYTDTQLANYTTTEDLTTALGAKANSADVYTKTAADATFATAAQGTKADNAASAIAILNGDNTQAGSVAKTVKDAVDAATSTLNTAIDAKANSVDVYTKTAADDKFATQTGVRATIARATVPVMATWGGSQSTTITVDAPAQYYAAMPTE